MADMSVYKAVERLGERMFAGRIVLPELALAVAMATLAGEVGLDDANDVYEAYYTAAQRHSVDRKAMSFRVNASKLRQLIALIEEHRHNGIKLLRQTMAIHALVYKRGKVTYLDCYNAVVAVARVRLRSKKPLSEQRIKRAMRG